MLGIARPFISQPQAPGQRTSFVALPKVLQAYIAATIVAAALILLALAGTIRLAEPRLFLGVLITSVVLAATKIRLPLLPSSATVSLSYCTNFAGLVLFEPFEATFIIAVSVWSQCVLNNAGKMATYRTVFSIANIIIATQAASVAAHMTGGFRAATQWHELVVPTLASATAFFFCNTLLLAEAVALESRKPVSRLWHDQFLWSAPACFFGAALGTTAAFLIQTSNRFAIFIAIPLLLFYWGYRTYLGFIEKQDMMHLATVEALARAIGARDQTLEASRAVSDTHVRRVQRLAVSLARRAGMSPDELKGVEVAALLHDIGKLAVPEHILNKPGRLTQEEFQSIRLHPTVGAEIISAVDFGYPVAPLIASHHERWNGAGYPSGLRGEEIPLGSRVLGIVDYFDALIADRPYHKALAEQDAKNIIREEAGKALDPQLVEMFLSILEEEPVTVDLPHARGLDAQPRQPAQGLARHTPPPADGVQSAIENIARANQEMGALYDLTEALGNRLSVGDTMALLASKLSALVPATSWALFVYDDIEDTTRCEFATGLDSDLLRRLAVPNGSGAIGWLARRGEPIRNARPGADFDAAGLFGTPTSLRSMIAYPLSVHDNVIGALAAYHVTHEYFTEAHLGTLEKVAPKASMVVHDARTFEKVRSESLTDALTGLPNSRALMDHIEKEMSKADRYHTERALLVIDVDRFKSVNDQYGHQAGDRALQEIAGILRRSVRVYDFCARHGGDEFVVVLQECDAHQAIERARELQEAVSAMPLEVVPNSGITLGISVGHATYPVDGQSLEVLLRRADHRMYQNKSARKRALYEQAATVPVGVDRSTL